MILVVEPLLSPFVADRQDQLEAWLLIVADCPLRHPRALRTALSVLLPLLACRRSARACRRSVEPPALLLICSCWMPGSPHGQEWPLQMCKAVFHNLSHPLGSSHREPRQQPRAAYGACVMMSAGTALLGRRPSGEWKQNALFAVAMIGSLSDEAKGFLLDKPPSSFRHL